MRNLKILLNSTYQNSLLVESDLVILGKRNQAVDLKLKINDLFCITNKVLYRIELDVNKVTLEYSLSSFFDRDDIPKAVSMWYRDLQDTVSVCFESGEIMTLNLNPFSVQAVFCLNSSVSHINWSPDEEFAIVSSGFGDLYLINSDYDTVSLLDINDSSLGVKQLINVGWGKKETQFHRSEGKKAAISKADESHEEDLEGKNIYEFKTTWRGDSNLFAVGFFCPVKKRRLVKIFSNEGVLQCVSEEIPGLEDPLVWKPQGNLITFSQKLPNKYVIGFMEKNGLKHGEFTLPKNVQVKGLCWNQTSTILCSVCHNTETQEEEILLWTTGNYHWYLKQKLKFKSPLKSIWWDEERSNRLYILRSNGKLHILEWTFAVDSSYYSLYEKCSNVAVINGDEILITSFKKAIIPPPLFSYKLKCPGTVNQVIFPPIRSRDSLLLCAVLANGSLIIFMDSKTDSLIFSSISGIEPLPDLLSLAHWEWVEKDAFIFCYSDFNESRIYHLDLEESSLSLRNSIKIKENVITCSRAEGKVIIQTSKGKLLNYNLQEKNVGYEDFSFVEPSIDVKIHTTGVYSLSECGRFYKNQLQIYLPSDKGHITSFLLRDPYVLLTTSAHKLVIFEFEKTHESSERKLERGSRLVTVCGDLVILQTPRGNLETIQPRALTVLTVGDLINAKQYKEALTLLRKQRIDLNLIIDHNQTEFFQNVNQFVRQVDPQWIILLITELSNEDVTKTTYNYCYNSKNTNKKNSDSEKVFRVCNNLIKEMTSDDADKKKFELPILSALVKAGKMEEAINLAKSEQTLQHLMFIVDSNKLYIEALGAYNLEAALKIAEKSRKDPKEYIPFLNSLREMEPNYMRFTVDKSLNRNYSALEHLSKCSEDHLDECYNFIKDHSLYSFAFRLFSCPEKRAKIAEMLAEHTYKIRCYEESGIMYLRAGINEKAVESFIKAGDWRNCMRVAMKEDFSEDKRRVIAENLCSILVSNQQFSDAAIMYLEWLSDVEKTVEMYIEGKYWKEALYTAEKFKKFELLELTRKALLKSSLKLQFAISDNMTTFLKYSARLKEVRLQKQNRPVFTYGDFSDTASDTSSMSSQQTKSFQTRSSSNTKKMNRRLWSLKEGNPREEEALVAALSQSIQSAEKFVHDVHSTTSVLLSFDEQTTAYDLQCSMKRWLDNIEEHKKSIWPKNPEIDEATLLDDKYKHPPEIRIMPNWCFTAVDQVSVFENVGT